MKRYVGVLFAVLSTLGLGMFPHGSAEAAPAAPDTYEVIEYNARGERIAHHGLIQANTWVAIQTINSTPCTGIIRMGTFGDGYAEFRTTDTDCHGKTGVAVQTSFFGSYPWSPAGCTFQNSYNGLANPDWCHHLFLEGGGWQIQASGPGPAFMMKVQLCEDTFASPGYLCSPTVYYGFIPH